MTGTILVLASLCVSTAPYYGIRVVDEATGRGVPLVELRTVNDIAFVTDSAGWVAFHEPGLMNREVYFAVSSPGYEFLKDGFGFRGARLTPSAGASTTLQIKRTNIAERLYRITGGGVHRDSVLLGLPTPIPQSNAGVLGQDSVQTALYRGKMFWLWGDTNLPNYPLGNFQTTAATMNMPAQPDKGIVLDYFMDPQQPNRVRKMMPLAEPGVVWLFGLLATRDDRGNEALISHFTRRKDLATQLEQGLARFDDEAGVFKRIASLNLAETWRYPRGNAVRHGDYFYFASPFCHTRVKAQWADLIDPDNYEALSFDPATKSYSWRRDRDPTTQKEERELLRDGKLTAEAARYRLLDAAGEEVTIHGASVSWNEYRKRWVLIGVQSGDRGAPSFVGEVWYAEADDVAGPWMKAIKIATHPRYSFYNPKHHAMFDREGGQVIYFEGTYTQTFSGAPAPTPRYEYNQLMYRLDLADSRLAAVR